MKAKGLSLADAHKSGKKYKRPCEDSYYRYGRWVNIEDATATDYELEPEAKLLTREEVNHAFNICWGANNQMYTKQIMLDILFGSEGDV